MQYIDGSAPLSEQEVEDLNDLPNDTVPKKTEGGFGVATLDNVPDSATRKAVTAPESTVLAALAANKGDLRIPETVENGYYTVTMVNSNCFTGSGGKLCRNTEDAETVYPLDYYPDSHVLGLMNTFHGQYCGDACKEGNLNSFFGCGAGMSCTIGDQDTYIGGYAGINQIDGYHNTYVGVGAGQSDVHGYHNTLMGCDVMLLGGDCNSCTGVGVSSGTHNAGNGNSWFGVSCFSTNTSGQDDAAFGRAAMYNNTTGSYCFAGGVASLMQNTTGSYNVGAGYYALYAQTTGSNNVGVGSHAGRFAADGVTDNAVANSCLYLGAGTRALASGATNEIVVGSNAIGLGTNTAVYGSSAVTISRIWGKVAIGLDAPTQPFHVRAATDNAWISTFQVSDAKFARFLFGINASNVDAPSFIFDVGNTSGSTQFSFDKTGTFAAGYLQVKTVVTAASSGTVTVKSDTAGAKDTAGFLPFKTSDGTTVGVPYVTLG